MGGQGWVMQGLETRVFCTCGEAAVVLLRGGHFLQHPTPHRAM